MSSAFSSNGSSASSGVREDPDDFCDGRVAVNLHTLGGTSYKVLLDRDATVGQLLSKLKLLATSELRTSLETQTFHLARQGSQTELFSLNNPYLRLMMCAPIPDMVANGEEIHFQLICSPCYYIPCPYTDIRLKQQAPSPPAVSKSSS